MICPTCRGRGFTPRLSWVDDLDAIDNDVPAMGLCETCGGSGIASCCDAAGSPEPRFVCAACGAIQQHRMIKCEQCGEPLVFPKFADDDAA